MFLPIQNTVPLFQKTFLQSILPISCTGKSSRNYFFCPQKLHLLLFQIKQVDVILAGWPLICKNWLKSYLMQVCKPRHYALVEAVEPFKLHPMAMSYIYEVFEHLLGLWMGYGFTITLLPPPTVPESCESWLKSYLMQVCKPCYYALVEAIEPFKLHPMSMWYIYEKFEHLLRLCMGIWLHTHTINMTDTSPDLWELAEILLMQVCKTCESILAEAVQPFKLYCLVWATKVSLAAICLDISSASFGIQIN